MITVSVPMDTGKQYLGSQGWRFYAELRPQSFTLPPNSMTGYTATAVHPHLHAHVIASAARNEATAASAGACKVDSFAVGYEFRATRAST